LHQVMTAELAEIPRREWDKNRRLNPCQTKWPSCLTWVGLGGEELWAMTDDDDAWSLSAGFCG